MDVPFNLKLRVSVSDLFSIPIRSQSVITIRSLKTTTRVWYHHYLRYVRRKIYLRGTSRDETYTWKEIVFLDMTLECTSVIFSILTYETPNLQFLQ